MLRGIPGLLGEFEYKKGVFGWLVAVYELDTFFFLLDRTTYFILLCNNPSSNQGAQQISM